MVNHHRYTENITVQFLYGCHIGQIHFGEVRHFRYTDGTIGHCLIASGIHSRQSHIVTFHLIRQNNLLRKAQSRLPASLYTAAFKTFYPRNLNEYIIQYAVIFHREIQVELCFILYQYGNLLTRGNCKCRILKVPIHRYQHILRHFTPARICYGHFHGEAFTDFITLEVIRIAQLILRLGSSIDFDQINGLVQIKIGTLQIDGYNSILVSQRTFNGKTMAGTGFNMIRHQCHSRNLPVYIRVSVIVTTSSSP